MSRLKQDKVMHAKSGIKKQHAAHQPPKLSMGMQIWQLAADPVRNWACCFLLVPLLRVLVATDAALPVKKGSQKLQALCSPVQQNMTACRPQKVCLAICSPVF